MSAVNRTLELFCSFVWLPHSHLLQANPIRVSTVFGDRELVDEKLFLPFPVLRLSSQPDRVTGVLSHVFCTTYFLSGLSACQSDQDSFSGKFAVRGRRRADTAVDFALETFQKSPFGVYQKSFSPDVCDETADANCYFHRYQTGGCTMSKSLSGQAQILAQVLSFGATTKWSFSLV